MKNLKRTMIFVLGFVMLLFALTPFFVPQGDNIYAQDKSPSFNGVFAEKAQSLDILFAGDSESYTNFMPMEYWEAYNWKAYNIGVPSINLRESHKILEEVLENQTPQLLVIETNHFFKDIGDWTSTINHTLSSKMNKMFPIIIYHDNWKQLLEHGRSEGVNIQRNPLKGFRLNRQVQAYDKKVSLKATDEQVELSKSNLDYIESMVKMAQDKGIKVLFVTAPSAKNWRYARYNTVEEIAGHLGVDHLDLNLIQKELGIDWAKDTYDRGDHVNLFGAKKVNNYLKKYLKEHYEIKVTASDEEMKLWDQDLSLYKRSIH